MNPLGSRVRRWAFAAFAVAVFVATHWPNLQLPGTGRPDLLVHVVVFAAWTAMLILAGFFGPPFSLRNIGMAALIAPVYAAIDEGLQAIPFIRRHAAFDDWGANVSGIAFACLAALAVRAALGLKAAPSGAASNHQPGDSHDR